MLLFKFLLSSNFARIPESPYFRKTFTLFDTKNIVIFMKKSLFEN